MSDTNQKWFFEDDSDKELGIETCTYENGNKVKRATLSDGRVVICRELKGKDMKHVDRICGGKKDEYLPALMHISAKILDGDKETNIALEEFDEMKGKDYTTIKMLATSLNF